MNDTLEPLFIRQTPLIEIPFDELSRQMAEQYDRWSAADSEEKQATGIAEDERTKLDEILAEFMRRSKSGAQPSLLGGRM